VRQFHPVARTRISMQPGLKTSQFLQLHATRETPLAAADRAVVDACQVMT
jgi:hypothetical protein